MNKILIYELLVNYLWIHNHFQFFRCTKWIQNDFSVVFYICSRFFHKKSPIFELKRNFYPRTWFQNHLISGNTNKNGGVEIVFK